MLSKIRQSVFTKTLWGLMGLFLLNISVDATDPNPDSIPEDLSINDQESILEIIFEQILGYEDAFEEYDDHDTEDHTKKTRIKIDFTNPNLAEVELNIIPTGTARQNFPDPNRFLTKGFQKLDLPPPKI